MFDSITKWQILFVIINTLQATIQTPSNNTLHLSFGFFCIYCGRPDHTHSYMSLTETRKIIDCSEPYHIYCSYKEAIGCVKYIKIMDYHIDIIKDCLRLTDLPSLTTFDIQCQSEYAQRNVNIKDKTFCCNNTHFCNRTSSVFLLSKKCLLTFFHLFILLIYHYDLSYWSI
jgi:hypothetical protein